MNKPNDLKHIGIIIDGNRRFAKRLMLEPWKGHEVGLKKVEDIVGWLKELNIKEITIYCFSLENFNRPKKEVDFLMKVFKREFSKLTKNETVHQDKIKINFIGKIELFDKELQEITKEATRVTKDYNNHIINFALGYGGRQEIIHAAREIQKSGEEITEENFTKHLWLQTCPDLIIRTGGDHRTSNFLVWQAAYSEWIFLDKTWPEFEKEDLINSIKEFNNRERRFGK